MTSSNNLQARIDEFSMAREHHSGFVKIQVNQPLSFRAEPELKLLAAPRGLDLSLLTQKQQVLLEPPPGQRFLNSFQVEAKAKEVAADIVSWYEGLDEDHRQEVVRPLGISDIMPDVGAHGGVPYET